MKWIWICLLCFMPSSCRAESLQEAAQQLIGTLELSALDDAARQVGWLEGGAAELITRLAKGETVMDAAQVGSWLAGRAAGIFRSSLWRMTRLMVPAVLAGSAQWLQHKPDAAGKAARYAGLLITMVFLTADLKEHAALCMQTLEKMDGWMQALFPLMITLLAAVGGTASSAFYQLINTRASVMGLPTIISTNLTHHQLEKQYDTATLSRLLGDFKVKLFLGSDIRRAKLSF